MLDVVVGGLTLAYAGLFGASAFAKLTRWEEARDWIADLLSGRSAAFVLALLVVAEMTIMATILVWHPVGAGIGTTWLVGASVCCGRHAIRLPSAGVSVSANPSGHLSTLGIPWAPWQVSGSWSYRPTGGGTRRLLPPPAPWQSRRSLPMGRDGST